MFEDVLKRMCKRICGSGRCWRGGVLVSGSVRGLEGWNE